MKRKTCKVKPAKVPPEEIYLPSVPSFLRGSDGRRIPVSAFSPEALDIIVGQWREKLMWKAKEQGRG